MARLIACSRMYNVDPACRSAWDTIFAWVSNCAGVALDVVPHAAPAPLQDLWARDDMGCVFMCGWPWAMAAPRPILLAAPAPSPPRYGGRAVYFTDFVVRDDGPIRRLEDSFGGRLAWTVDHSHSGFNAPRHHLLRYRTADRPMLYAETKGPLVSPVRALRSVIDGEADIAPLDSLFVDLLRRHAPERLAALRVVDTTEAAPMPPLVASADADPEDSARLRRALLAAHDAPELRGALADVLVERFVPVSPETYAPTLAWADEADASGYPFPG